MMHTILGAGGPIGNGLANEFAARKIPFRLVGRKPKSIPGAEVVSADLADKEATIKAVAGSSIVYLLAGLKYEIGVWRQLWPLIMDNVVEACKRANAKLVFFDNVYMYGKVSGAMTEETPYAPCSKKGEVRAEIATSLMSQVKTGNLTAMIARCADFYGLATPHGVPNILVFEAFARGATASWLVNADVPHSFTFIPDAVCGLVTLTGKASAWNQVWHLPTAPEPPTGREFIAMAAKEFGVKPKLRVLSRPMIRLVGLFDLNVRESYEMLYQSDSPYLFDSTKFAKEFGYAGTPYAEGIHQSVQSYTPQTDISRN
jgi:nucleoside-diphosphate-sugar epimerase